jgi:uncharacterized membrane protein YoaK (UPF0700 family)
MLRRVRIAEHTPAWVLLSALALSGIAGSINAVALLGVDPKGVTHVTGALTQASSHLAEGDTVTAGHAAATVFAFLLGSILSGIIIRDPTLKMGRRYGVGLMVEGALLGIAWHFLRAGRTTGDHFAAAACGLQNALATNYSGAVRRTTHMTGVLTDLGLLLGHAMRRQPIHVERLRIYLALLVVFVLGGAVGTTSYARLGADALLLPALATGLGGAVYWLLQRHFHASRDSLDDARNA